MVNHYGHTASLRATLPWAWMILTLPVLAVGALLVLAGAVEGSLHTAGLPAGKYEWYMAVTVVVISLHVGTGLLIRAAADRIPLASERSAAQWCALAVLTNVALLYGVGDLATNSHCSDTPPCGFAVGGLWDIALAAASWTACMSLLAFAAAFVRFVWKGPSWVR